MAHPRVKKMNVDLKPIFFLKGMKKDIVKSVARCLECQWVKVENQHTVGLLHPHEVP